MHALLLHRPDVALVVVVALLSSAGLLILRLGVSERHKRGVVVRTARSRSLEVRRACWGRARPYPKLSLAGVPLEHADETRHFKLIGATGAGKSTAIRQLIDQVIARGDRVLFADPDGGYCTHFFRRYRGDVVLNPFERDSVRWDPFAELRAPYDIEQLAGALIAPSADPAAGEWRGYARTLLGAILRRCRDSTRNDCAELWRLVAVAPVEELRTIVADTPAQPFLDPDNARMFGSIRSVAVSAMAALEHVQAQRASPFSVREWVCSRHALGCLFLPYRAAQIAALRSVIATWVRLAIFEALNGEEGRDQRLWFVVDELDALGVIDGLKDALARLRKFGGRCVLGFQSLGQVSSTYGADAQSIVENCGNTLILRCSSSEQGGTAQFASRLIGEREVLRKQVTRNVEDQAPLGISRGRRSRNTSEQHVIESAVMASEIEQLADLSGYLKRASSPHWMKVRIVPRSSERRRLTAWL